MENTMYKQTKRFTLFYVRETEKHLRDARYYRAVGLLELADDHYSWYINQYLTCLCACDIGRFRVPGVSVPFSVTPAFINRVKDWPRVPESI